MFSAIRSAAGSWSCSPTGSRPPVPITAVIREEFGITQSAVSQHLRVLRDNGFATVRPEGTRRLYAVDSVAVREVDEWLDHFRGFWSQPLDALATELARGRRERRLASGTGASTDSTTKTQEDLQ